MKQTDASELLLQTWKAELVTALRPALEYAFDNESFRSSDAVWARVSLVYGTSQQRSMGRVGTRRFEHFGTIAVQLFGELDRGRAPVDALADDVRSVFQSRHLTAVGDPLWTKAASVPAQTNRDGWFMLAFSVPFSYFSLA